jgi:hypothetical protein
VRSLDDERLRGLREIDDWFKTLELSVTSGSKCSNKALLSFQCNEDIHACNIGFISLCNEVLKICAVYCAWIDDCWSEWKYF